MVGDIAHSTRSPLFDGVGGGGDGEGEEGSGGGSDGSEVLHFDNVWGFVGGMGKRVEGWWRWDWCWSCGLILDAGCWMLDAGCWMLDAAA